MTRITYVAPDDALYEVDVPDGESLMRGAVQNDIPGIVGECGGELTCGTCHVYIPVAWQDQTGTQSQGEQDLLSMMDDVRPESRLACQVTVTADLDGLATQISEHQ